MINTAKRPARAVKLVIMDSEPDISWTRLSAFMRQHTHDVRNGLNALDLETALLQEIITDEEGLVSLERVRRQVRGMAEHLRSLSALFQEPKPYSAPLAARELLLIWREQHESMPERPAVEWIEEVGDAKVNVDAGMMASVFRELLTNARTFRDGEPAIASARRHGDEVEYELREPKLEPIDVSAWDDRVFQTTKRGGYGLGLWTVRRQAEANGATLTRRNEAGALVTCIALPACK